jgi:hypothetical protein
LIKQYAGKGKDQLDLRDNGFRNFGEGESFPPKRECHFSMKAPGKVLGRQNK